MKILVEHGDFEENEIVIRCRDLDSDILEILGLLRERSSRITAIKDGELHVLQPNDIYYAESVDGKTFIYKSDIVLETPQSLAALQDANSSFGFIRIGKSQLVNLFHVAKLKSLPNSRIEITLKNGERLIVSRHYIHDLKEKLGMTE